MPNANAFREVNRIYKLPFAVPITLVTSWSFSHFPGWGAGRAAAPAGGTAEGALPLPRAAQNTSLALPGAIWKRKGTKC